MLEAHADGKVAVSFGDCSIGLGSLGAASAGAIEKLRSGLPLDSLVFDEAIDPLVRRLARHGLLEYGLRRAGQSADLVVIEPQVADYWPRMAPIGETDVHVLSRFAYLRRRGNDLVLESPRARALFKLCDPAVAAAVAMFSTPQPIKQRQQEFPDLQLLALLLDCQILFKVERDGDLGQRSSEGDSNLVLWDFHDLLFHARASEGRHANPVGGAFPHVGTIAPLPAVRPSWSGNAIELSKISDAGALSPLTQLLRGRHSARSFDAERPITLAELSQFLNSSARILSKWNSEGDFGDGGPMVEHTMRPYPSAGASYELELYLAVDACEGLGRGFYHYDAGAHALTPIEVGARELDAMFAGAQYAMDAPGKPQILITIAARFGRMSWKYSSIAYALILKDVGVLTQTLYLVASERGLGGCAIGPVNVDLFAKMTGIEFHIEGPVGQFALGRPLPSQEEDAAGT
jgi:SagB-type dehydrogenase family enzyme